MLEIFKKYASPLTVSGALLFLLGLLMLVFYYQEFIDSDGYGFLMLGGVWLAAIILITPGLIIRAIFKKNEPRFFVDSLLLIIAIILLIQFYE